MRNGTGTYELPAGNPVVTGTTITSSWANATMPDLGAEITNSIPRDGQAPPTANLPMGGFKHTGAANGVNPQDYATMNNLNSYALLASPSFTGTAEFVNLGTTGTITSAGQLLITATGSGTASSIQVTSAGNNSIGQGDTTQAADAKYWDSFVQAGALQMRAVNDANTAANAWVTVSRTGYAIGSITFSSPTQLIIDNTASSALKLQFTNNGTSTGIIQSTAGDCFIAVNGANTLQAFLIDQSGNGTFAGTYQGGSDRRVKSDIQDLELSDAYHFVLGYKAVTYKMRDGKHRAGAIAQQIEKLGVVGELVVDRANKPIGGLKNFRTTDVNGQVAALMAVVQDLHARIAELEAR